MFERKALNCSYDRRLLNGIINHQSTCSFLFIISLNTDSQWSMKTTWLGGKIPCHQHEQGDLQRISTKDKKIVTKRRHGNS